MPVFILTEEIAFPSVELATEDGVLAVGGDLSPDRLLKAYSQGIFPWYSEPEPILWWSPNPRFVIFPDELRVSKSMKRILKKQTFNITCDKCFYEVINGCRQPRGNNPGTWITAAMLKSYCKMHELGYAHSVEAWNGSKLVGGLYGISLGSCFFGESMFSIQSNASKAAFIIFTRRLKELGFTLIDCQVYTKHLESLGARNISRKEYIRLLHNGLKVKTHKGKWTDIFENCFF